LHSWKIFLIIVLNISYNAATRGHELLKNHRNCIKTGCVRCSEDNEKETLILFSQPSLSCTAG
jgi:hypothetical protein